MFPSLGRSYGVDGSAWSLVFIPKSVVIVHTIHRMKLMVLPFKMFLATCDSSICLAEARPTSLFVVIITSKLSVPAPMSKPNLDSSELLVSRQASIHAFSWYPSISTTILVPISHPPLTSHASRRSCNDPSPYLATTWCSSPAINLKFILSLGRRQL
jgi:hypothetical protein